MLEKRFKILLIFAFIAALTITSFMAIGITKTKELKPTTIETVDVIARHMDLFGNHSYEIKYNDQTIETLKGIKVTTMYITDENTYRNNTMKIVTNTRTLFFKFGQDITKDYTYYKLAK